jgi:hypothetical protein
MVRRMLSLVDQIVLDIFRSYLVTPGELLCFHGKWLDEHAESLRHLTAMKLITKEEFKGAYSLTEAGYAAIHGAGEIATSDELPLK